MRKKEGSRPRPQKARTWLSPLAPWSSPLTQSPAMKKFWMPVDWKGRLAWDPGLKWVTAWGGGGGGGGWVSGGGDG
jgi:hypothetical protein